MTMVFNYRAFYKELNKTRKMRNNMAWNKVATRAGVSPSGVHLFARQYEIPDSSATKALSVENLVKLMTWMGQTDLSPYLVEEDHPDVL